MNALFAPEAMRKILQRGLVAGYWSISQFNKTSVDKFVIPNWEFLDEHPEFTDMEYRDMDAFSKHTFINPFL